MEVTCENYYFMDKIELFSYAFETENSTLQRVAGSGIGRVPCSKDTPKSEDWFTREYSQNGEY